MGDGAGLPLYWNCRLQKTEAEQMTEKQENEGCGNFEKTVAEVVKAVSSRLDCE